MAQLARDQIDVLLDAFDDAWKAGRRPDIAETLSRAAECDRSELLRELVHLELDYRLGLGERVRVEEYLLTYPELAADREAVLRLIRVECQGRVAAAERVTLREYLDRFPTYQDDLPARLSTIELVPSEVPGYEILAEIGRGGMGVIHRAIDVEFGRSVAVKFIRSPFTDHTEAVERFREEARITGRLQHPGVPPVHRLGTLEGGRPYLTMKLIQGHTLAVLLSERTNPAAELAQLLHVFEQVCQTLAYAHKQGVVHRDLKPSNVMVGEFGEVQVMDWGLAKVMRGAATEPGDGAEEPAPNTAPDSGRTQAGQVIGTPQYMPPEQARGEHHRVDARADVYALGAILCEMLTGKPPYAGAPDALAAAQQGRLDEAWRRLDACGADEEVITLAKRCLVDRPESRPADAAALVKVLATYREAVEARLRESERERDASRIKIVEERRRRRIQRWLLAAVFAVAVVGGGFGWYADHTASQRRAEKIAQDAEYTARAENTRKAAASAMERGTASLRSDRPAEAVIALGEARRRLTADEQADDDGQLNDRLSALEQQLALQLKLNDIRDLQRIDTGGAFDVEAARREFPSAFRSAGVDVSRPDAVASRIGDWAIRDQVIGALDLWLFVENKQPGLRESLAVLDPNPDRNAWREAVSRGDPAERETAARRLGNKQHPPLFLAAYGELLPLPLLRSGWNGKPDSYPLAFVIARKLRPASKLTPRGAADNDESIAFYRVCLALRPDHVPAMINLSARLLDKDVEEALVWSRKAVAAAPNRAEAHYNLGVALHARNADEAIVCYTRALQLHPKLLGALNNLGVLHTAKEQFKEAIECFARFKQVRGDDPDVLCQLGYCLLMEGRVQEAIDNLQTGHDLGVKRRDWALPSAQWLRQARQARDLEERLPRLLSGEEVLSGPRAYADLGVVCARLLRRYGDALLLYQEAIRLDPNYELIISRARAAAAVRAAHGDGHNPPPENARPALRLLAKKSLLLDLMLCRRLASGTADQRKLVPGLLKERLNDRDFSSVRDPEELAKLPADERQEWDNYWVEVRRMLKEISE